MVSQQWGHSAIAATDQSAIHKHRGVWAATCMPGCSHAYVAREGGPPGSGAAEAFRLAGHQGGTPSVVSVLKDQVPASSPWWLVRGEFVSESYRIRQLPEGRQRKRLEP